MLPNLKELFLSTQFTLNNLYYYYYSNYKSWAYNKHPEVCFFAILITLLVMKIRISNIVNSNFQ